MSPRTLRPANRNVEWRRREAAAIGARIREIRAERGMTQGQVAGDRYTKAYMSALETGGAFPSTPSLIYIASQLRVPPAALLTGGALTGEVVAQPVTISRAWFADGRIFVELDDGRFIGLPVARSSRLSRASLRDLDGWEITEYGRVVSWPALGEEISVDDFLGVRVLDADDEGTATEFPRRSSRAASTRAGRYDKLNAWLSGQSGQLSVAMAAIEQVIGAPLPASARRYTSPWYSVANPLARAIRAAGWKATVDLAGERVTFARR